MEIFDCKAMLLLDDYVEHVINEDGTQIVEVEENPELTEESYYISNLKIASGKIDENDDHVVPSKRRAQE